VRARIWGCRGSLATPGRETLRFGGNTSCVEIALGDGTALVLDAGSGLRSLGLELAKRGERTVHLLLTHLHIDHVEGLGLFAPLWNAEAELNVWGPPSLVRTLHERIARYLSPPLFPFNLAAIPSRLRLRDVPSAPWHIGSAVVRAEAVSHPGSTLGYRVEEDGRSLAYIPDHEPALGVELESLTRDWVSGHSLAAGSTVLLHDAQYTEDEYPQKIGWGHSSVADAVAFARMAETERLVLFHHDPEHTDDDLLELESRASELWRDRASPPELAFEGMEIDV
jgi:phosphoribosyl 1,2-cyclic phosphodiesterase